MGTEETRSCGKPIPANPVRPSLPIGSVAGSATPASEQASSHPRSAAVTVSPEAQAKRNLELAQQAYDAVRSTAYPIQRKLHPVRKQRAAALDPAQSREAVLNVPVVEGVPSVPHPTQNSSLTVPSTLSSLSHPHSTALSPSNSLSHTQSPLTHTSHSHIRNLTLPFTPLSPLPTSLALPHSPHPVTDSETRAQRAEAVREPRLQAHLSRNKRQRQFPSFHRQL